MRKPLTTTCLENNSVQLNGRMTTNFLPEVAASNLAVGYNVTALGLHQCDLPEGSPLHSNFKLAVAYIPGVHPTGPFHRKLTLGYRERLKQIQQQWQQYSPQPPDAVVVASLLWDIARMYAYELHHLSGSALCVDVVESWMANYTKVVQHAQQLFPDTHNFLYHTSLPPRIFPDTGESQLPYLGRRYFIQQLNQAGMTAARQLGLATVDYSKIGDRFLDGQRHLTDNQHPTAAISLEIANIYLNILAQASAAAGAAA